MKGRVTTNFNVYNWSGYFYFEYFFWSCDLLSFLHQTKITTKNIGDNLMLNTQFELLHILFEFFPCLLSIILQIKIETFSKRARWENHTTHVFYSLKPWWRVTCSNTNFQKSMIWYEIYYICFNLSTQNKCILWISRPLTSASCLHFNYQHCLNPHIYFSTRSMCETN